MTTGAIATVAEDVTPRRSYETAKLIAVVTAILQAMSLNDNNKAKADKGDSAVGYLALCSAWSAATKATTAILPDFPTTAAFEEIQQFNISLATKEWQTLIDGAPDNKGWDAIKPSVKQKASEVDWANEWPGWASAREAIKSNSDQWQKNNTRGFAEEHILELRALINATAEQAKSLNAELTRPLLTDGFSYQERLKQLGKNAMCGGMGDHIFVGHFCKDTNGDTDKAKAVTCAKDNNGVSIGMDIVCMCTASANDKCATGANAYEGGSTTIQADAIKTLTDECPGTGAEIEIPTAINEALHAVRAAITWSEGQGQSNLRIIGKSAGNGCAESTDRCVDYSEYYKKGGGFDRIPWVRHLLDIAKLYKEYTKHLAEKAVIKSHLEALRDRVRIEYTRHRPETKLRQTQGQGEGDSAAENNSKQNVCDKHHASQDNCNKARCDYDATAADGKKCKPKAGTENTAAATGNGAAGSGSNTETKKCSDNKTEKDCKDGCKWDGKECKDSSILVNKQFALTVVSAAFAALIF